MHIGLYGSILSGPKKKKKLFDLLFAFVVFVSLSTKVSCIGCFLDSGVVLHSTPASYTRVSGFGYEMGLYRNVNNLVPIFGWSPPRSKRTSLLQW